MLDKLVISNVLNSVGHSQVMEVGDDTGSWEH